MYRYKPKDKRVCKLCGGAFPSGEQVIEHVIDYHKVDTNRWFHGREFIDGE